MGVSTKFYYKDDSFSLIKDDTLNQEINLLDELIKKE